MTGSTSLRLILASGTAFAALCALPGAAFAQTAGDQTTAPAASSATDNTGDDIVVTGSRVVRNGYKAPTPLTVLNRDDIDNSSPSNNIADFLNQLPSVAGSTKPANSRLNLSSGQAGINQINLRNADGPTGGTRTLVLLDGRRSVPSTINGVVDINTIPQALVKSVEIVTGGASAAYGSDAVAGVLNFILDKKYTGLRIEADNGITTYGDGSNYSGSITGGLSFAGGRGHILVNAEIAHRNGIFNVDRAWNATGYIAYQNPAWTASSNLPRYLIGYGLGPTNSTPGSIILASTGGTANRLRGIYFGPNGQQQQYQYGSINSTTPGGTTVTQGGDWLVNDSGRRIGLDPQDDRYGLFGRLSFEVGSGVELFAEAAYNRQRVQFNAGPNLASCGSFNAANIGANAATGACTLAPDNAYLIQALGPAQLAGITGVAIGTTAADLPYRGVDNRRRVQRYTIGAEGTFDAFSRPAHWDIYAQYGRTDLREQLRNVMNLQRTANAVDAVFAPAGNPGGYAPGTVVCRINVDATASNDDKSCVPLNRLGLGVANPASLAYFLGDPYRDETLKQYAAGANLSLTPFATWAGDVSVAIGAEYRKEQIKGFVPIQYQPPIINGASVNQWSVGNYLPSNGQYDVKEAYLETVVPLGFGLEVNGAARATDYSTAGYVTTWKLGAAWQPIKDIRFRITRSRDIRAPSLADLFNAGSANTSTVSNPNGAGGSINGIAFPTADVGYTGTVTGNATLKPEKASNFNVGVVLTPTFIPGLAISVDYFRLDIDDAIGSLTAQDIVNRCVAGDAVYCAAIKQDPASPTRLLIRSQPFNFANQLVRGIDFEASYRLPLNRLFAKANGAFNVRALATRYLENRIDQGIAGVVPIDTVGTNGVQSSTPTWIYRFNAGYESDDFSITAVARGVSAGKYVATGIECQAACPVSTTAFPTYAVNHINGTFYVDLNLTQKFAVNAQSRGEFFINVTNVFDKGPMLLPETGLAANSTYSDLLGRTFRVGARINFR